MSASRTKKHVIHLSKLGLRAMMQESFPEIQAKEVLSMALTEQGILIVEYLGEVI